MKWFLSVFNVRKSMLARLFVCLFCILLISSVALIIIWSQSTAQAVERLLLSHINDLIKNSTQNFENELFDYMDQINKMADSYAVKDYLADPSPENGAALTDYFQNYYNLTNNINGVGFFYGERKFTIGSAYFPMDFTASEIFRTVLDSHGGCLILNRDPQDIDAGNMTPRTLTLARSVENSGDVPVEIYVDLRSTLLIRSFGRLNLNGQIDNVVVDANGRPIFSTVDTLTQADLDQLIQSAQGQDASSFSKIVFQGTEYFLFSKTLTLSPQWKSITFVPKRIFDNTYVSTMTHTLWYMILILLTALIISIVISYYMDKKMRILYNHIENIHLDNLGGSAAFPTLQGSDEISMISSKISEMLQTISQQVATISDLNQEKRDYELQILRSQASPHFIYNTLGTIKTLAENLQSQSLVDLTQSLIEILQYTTVMDGALVTLSEELNHAKNYVRIMQSRYMNPINLILKVDPDTRTCLTPKLILQPIVENCIKHGLSDKPGEYIMISAYANDSALTITVTDNGKGMSPAKAASILKHPDPNHIGLTNIDKRIKLMYGDGYGLTITSIPHIQTTVSLNIPYAENAV